MTTELIEQILKMRMAVYKAGVKAGFWNDIDQSGASEMMNYIFPKSGQIAYYNLILELMRKEHNMVTGGAYTLFKMPVQVEKEIIDYLKKQNIEINNIVIDEISYLEDMDTITTDHSFVSVNIGTYSLNELETLLRLCASHYRYAFQQNINSYPYFE